MYAVVRTYSGQGASENLSASASPPAITEGNAVLQFGS
jgi:hypothetical protein